MSLDQNLFTLNVACRSDDPNVLDLVDPNGVVHYTKRRVQGTVYTIELIDPLSECVLATVTAPSPTSKHKTIQLFNPDLVVELKYTGTIHFKWGFRWEEHDFEWRREECYMIRKPDPAVLVAITKEPPGRLQTRSIQILDYNLNRHVIQFDIDDRKGLEIVILTALLTFQDLNETYHTPRSDTSPSTSPSESTATLAAASSTGLASRLGLSRQPSTVAAPPPAVPPRPAPRIGVERVAELHAIRIAQGEGDANEVEVGEECGIDDYAQYAERLLKDEAMLFVTVRSATAAQVPKVLRVVEETKRLRHKSGVSEDEELFQYVIYDTRQGSPQRKGPRRINLNDPDPKGKGKEQNKYAPPTSLTIHLSKIDMPELQPRVTSGSRRRSSGSALEILPEMPEKPRGKAEKDSKRAAGDSKKASAKERKEEKKQSKKSSVPGPIQSSSSRFTQSTNAPAPQLPPRQRPSSSYFHVPAHQIHPHQPSPSPSQLNNPMIYAAPPPAANVGPQYYPPAPPPMAFPTPSAPFYGSGPVGGYSAMPAHTVGGYQQPVYAARPDTGKPAGSSSSGKPAKGPVTSLLEMWSKH
ncbi:hypothetical protein C8Q73DRAFT_794025 [Cubamyces lactineus]|nr:hypothetical protein C8Q73DRAFT_794025 [Cubamyces lactineus]